MSALINGTFKVVIENRIRGGLFLIQWIFWSHVSPQGYYFFAFWIFKANWSILFINWMFFCKIIVSGPKIKITQKLLHFSIWTYFVFTLFSKKNVSKKLSGAHKTPFVCVNIEISNPQQLSGSERVTIMILILLSEV